MGKAKGIVSIGWSANFAYAIGLIVSDGSLSKDGRHIDFTSKEISLIRNFQTALGINYKVGKKVRGQEKQKKYYRIQIGDVQFYRFLESIGLMPNKTKIIKRVEMPTEFFFDFLRGFFDGDGHFYSYYDKRWAKSYMFYTVFSSASPDFIHWLQERIRDEIDISGHITNSKTQSVYQLKYAKKESRVLLQKMYKNLDNLYLSRKYLKILRSSAIV